MLSPTRLACLLWALALGLVLPACSGTKDGGEEKQTDNNEGREALDESKARKPDAKKDTGAWGTVKGRVVFAGDTVPQLPPLKVNKNQKHCLSKGNIPDEKLVVNPKNKGVRWVVVWLAKDNGGEADHAAELPVHESLKEIKQKEVVMDQPCCKFEPHVVALRVGQTFVGKNSSPIAHNMFIAGGNGVADNQSIGPGQSHSWDGWKANPRGIPTTVSCNIHGWMKGYIAVFPHPYFVITDADGNFEIKNAPAGKYRLIAWQENTGWLLGDDEPSKHGKLIEIKAGETTDAGTVPVGAGL